jgi:putative acyl-CoA dehydrogenase
MVKTAPLDEYATHEVSRLAALPKAEGQARRTVEMMALALQASLLLRHSTPAVADAFCARRLDRDWGHAFGTMPAGLAEDAILERMRIEAEPTADGARR